MKPYIATKPIPQNVVTDEKKIRDEGWVTDHLSSELEGVDGTGDLAYLIQDWVSAQGVEIIDQNGWEYSRDFTMEPDGLCKFSLYPYDWIFADTDEAGVVWSYDWDSNDHLNEEKSNGHIIYVEGYFLPDQEFFTTKLTFSDKLP